MRLPLIDGQGNFGSMDGDPPAAMRYTEARLARAAERCSTTSTRTRSTSSRTTTSSDREPTVLPAQFPNLLVNGAGGIAVGMATNIPPHNLGEVIDACLALIDDPDISIERLIELVPGPDFPTGGIILGQRRHPRGLCHRPRLDRHARASTHVEEVRKDREAIVVTEIPYQVNKARHDRAHRRAGAREAGIEGIADLRDEIDRDGVRVVIELKRDADRRRRAQPALPAHAAADQLRRQHAGARRRPAGAC